MDENEGRKADEDFMTPLKIFPEKLHRNMFLK